MLNEQGKQKAQQIGTRFDGLVEDLKYILDGNTSCREFSIVKAKLEEACFYAKKAMAKNPENNEGV